MNGRIRFRNRLCAGCRCIIAFLKELQAKAAQTVSCTEIGAELKLDPTQVRKDLEFVGVPGRPRIGYQLNALVEGIEHFLGWNNVNQAFLVGAGNLGAACWDIRGSRITD